MNLSIIGYNKKAKLIFFKDQSQSEDIQQRKIKLDYNKLKTYFTYNRQKYYINGGMTP